MARLSEWATATAPTAKRRRRNWLLSKRGGGGVEANLDSWRRATCEVRRRAWPPTPQNSLAARRTAHWTVAEQCLRIWTGMARPDKAKNTRKGCGRYRTDCRLCSRPQSQLSLLLQNLVLFRPPQPPLFFFFSSIYHLFSLALSPPPPHPNSLPHIIHGRLCRFSFQAQEPRLPHTKADIEYHLYKLAQRTSATFPAPALREQIRKNPARSPHQQRIAASTVRSSFPGKKTPDHIDLSTSADRHHHHYIHGRRRQNPGA